MRRIEVRDLNGDGTRDIVLVRGGSPTTAIEHWLRTSPTDATYVAGPPLGDFGPVIDAVVFDFDADGDTDIVLATGGLGTTGLTLLSNAGGSGFIPQFDRGALQPIDGVTRLRFQDVTTADGVRLGVAAITADGATLYVVVPGTGLVPTQTLPHPGGIATTLAMPFSATAGSAVLTLGAAPPRLWGWDGAAYAERAVQGIPRQVRQAASVTVDGDDVGDVVIADADHRVELWKGIAAAPEQPPDRFDVFHTVETEGATVLALDTLNLHPGTVDVVVGRLGPGSSALSRVHRITLGSGSVQRRDPPLIGGFAIGVERRSPDTLYLGSLVEPLRAYVRAGTAGSGTLGFAVTSGYFAVKGGQAAVRLSSTVPIPIAAPIGLSTPIGSVASAGIEGQRSFYVTLPPTYTQVLGELTLDLVDPQIPDVTLREPLSSTLAVFNGIFGDSFCAVECLLVPCVAELAVKRAANAAGIGTPSEVTLLRAFRDQVLAASAKGREYVAGYEAYESELYLASFADPTFLSVLRDAKDAWMPAIESLVDGDGSVLIDATLLDRLDAVFGHFRSHGSDGLRAMIDRRYLELDPRQFVDQPIAALRAHWENVLRTEGVFGDGFEAPAAAR